jgi:hypothetical protein
VPKAVTGYQGGDGHVAEMVHYTSLALGTSAASFGSDSLHQAEINFFFNLIFLKITIKKNQRRVLCTMQKFWKVSVLAQLVQILRLGH